MPLRPEDTFSWRSYWIPGSYAPALSEKHNTFPRLLKNKGFREESMTKVGLDALGTSTTLESNKSLALCLVAYLIVECERLGQGCTWRPLKRRLILQGSQAALPALERVRA